MHVAVDNINQADHGKKRDPREDETQAVLNSELDKGARLKKQTLLREAKRVRYVPILLI